MKNIVILGGGFAGITAGLTLSKNLNKYEADITLIDENTYHTFTPSLYEVATSEEPKKNIAIPLQSIFSNKINLIQAKITKIDVKNQKVITENQTVSWDYLIICMGSEINYFSIPGLQKHSYPLNTLEDAVKIKKVLNKIIPKDTQEGRLVNIIIGGGGFSGSELAAEIVNFRSNATKKNPQVSKLITLTILEANSRLLSGLDPKISDLTQKRLKSFNVNIITDCFIKEVKSDILETADGQTHHFDILIWTGGIRGNNVIEKSNLSTEISGRIPINSFLQIQGYNKIYAAGDCALFIDPNTQKPVPQTGQIAKDQGKIIAINIAADILGDKLVEFKMKNYSYIIPLKGRYALADIHFFKFIGFLGWVLQQLVFLRYLLMILPLKKALKKWNKFEQELKQE